ncbi:MAG: prolyl-tRNA synthetase associated domain-containing protein [Proteobacteria bacterium]|nr:prolyl-tRNA synthetase associated domain-containing protein [Pseudomonadota bacterium]MDA1308734.1 prolyl-tRNA synthetase associated domain-containing protein [Pseudomonadota bacterium]
MDQQIELTGRDDAPKAGSADVLARLMALGIEASTHEHPELFTVEQSKQMRGDLPGGHCKNLFLRDRKSRMWLVVCREDLRIDLKALGPKIGADRLSFGSADRLMRVLGVIPGAVSPLALINDTDHQVTVILDKAMLAFTPLNYHPISNEMTTAITPEDLMVFIRSCGHEPMVVDLDVGD